MGDMREALEGMARVGCEVMLRDRKGWTDADWLAEAREVFFGPDGSVSGLLNGHVSALFRVLDAGVPERSTDEEEG